jgi:peroxiredoxin
MSRARLGIAAVLLLTCGPAAADPFVSMSLIRPSRPPVARDFSLRSPDGKTTIKRADYAGKVLFLNFWATWCPPCREEMPAMQRLYQRYRDRGLVVVAVAVDTNTSGIQEFVRQQGFSFPVGQDADGEVAERYRVLRLPSTFLVDRNGNMVALAMGPREWDTTLSHAVIESLLR